MLKKKKKPTPRDFSNTLHSPGLSGRLPFLQVSLGCLGFAFLGYEQECNSRQNSCSNSVRENHLETGGVFCKRSEAWTDFIKLLIFKCFAFFLSLKSAPLPDDAVIPAVVVRALRVS